MNSEFTEPQINIFMFDNEHAITDSTYVKVDESGNKDNIKVDIFD